jgi:GAF domain-containing protein
MGAPRLDSEIEQKRSDVIARLDDDSIRDETSLDRIAQAASAVAEVPTAHVSLMRSDYQCVVGVHNGEKVEVPRDETLCAHTIVENEVLVVPDARQDSRFQNKEVVRGEMGLRFYVGLPVLVEDVPVGTIFATDTEPHTLRHDQRAELFGLLNTLESHFTVLYEHEPASETSRLSDHLACSRADMVRARFTGELDDRAERILVDAEHGLREGADLLNSEPSRARSDTDEEEGGGLGYEPTEAQSF